MTEQLPIKINITSDLIAKFSKISTVCNKLEAQFNFQTLTSNWYGDEENILTILLALETPESFQLCCNELGIVHIKDTSLPVEQQQSAYASDINRNEIVIKHFSDDVVCAINDAALQLSCHIAITSSELELLETQPKLLTGFIQVKLGKVLNLIADEKSLPKI